MAVASLPMTCPDCSGFGEINGAECYSCHGEKTRKHPRRQAWRRAGKRALEGAAAPAGHAVRLLSLLLRVLPGAGGATSVSVGAGWTAHAVWHPLPWWGVTMVVAGAFGLLFDRKMP